MVYSRLTTHNFLNLKPSWGWILSLGILFILMGFIGLVMSIGFTIVSIIFFGVLLIVAGISHIIYVFKYKNIKESLWQALIAFLYVLGGCLIIYDPLLGSLLITAFLAGAFVVIGITRIVMAFAFKATAGSGAGGTRVWLFLAGLAGIILGFILLAQWPMSALWFIGLWIAIELLMTGWYYIILALALRNHKG